MHGDPRPRNIDRTVQFQHRRCRLKDQIRADINPDHRRQGNAQFVTLCEDPRTPGIHSAPVRVTAEVKIPFRRFDVSAEIRTGAIKVHGQSAGCDIKRQQTAADGEI